MLKYLIITIMCLVMGLSSAQADETDGMDVQLKAVNQQIDEIQKNLSQDKVKRSQLDKDLRKTEMTIGQLTNDAQDIKKQLGLQQNKLNILKQQQTLYQQSLLQQQTELAAQIRTTYLMGRQDYLKLLLNQQNPAAVSRNMTYFKYFNQRRMKLIEELSETVKNLQSNQQELLAETQKLETLQQAQHQQQQQLQQVQQTRHKVLARLDQDIRSKKQQLKTLVSNKKNLQSLIKHLQNTPEQVVQTQMPIPFSQLKGTLSWPTRGDVSLHYDTPIDGSELTSSGVLINAPEGQPVYSIYPGRVLFANWLKGFGLLMIIDHGDGYMSLYGRNRSLFKKTGQNVNAGDLIAQVGESGGFDQSGLYFEIRYNGQPVNPERWCK